MKYLQAPQPSRIQKALGYFGLGFLFRGISPYDQRAYIGGQGGFSIAGKFVDELTALQVSAVFACVRLISQNVATLPIFVYKRETNLDDKKKYPDHPLYPLIHDRPNKIMTAAIWKQTMVAHLLLWGNHFSLIDYLGSDPVAAWPLQPDRMRVLMSYGGNLKYEYQTADGTKEYAAEQIFHPKIFSADGVTGISAIQNCKQTIGLSMSAEEYGAGLFRNGGRPSGVLKLKEGELTEEAGQRLRESWERIHSGTGSMGRVAILEEGMDYAAITLNMQDTQFLQNRKFQVQDICRIFGVPPHLVQEIDQPTYASVEAQKDEFLTFTLRPIMVLIEQELNLRFLGGQDARYTAAFNFQGFLRSDIKTRYEAYAIGRNWGWLTVNDICRLEDMNTIGPEGDKRLQPLNMTPSSGERPPTPDLTPTTPGATPTQQPAKPIKPNGSAVQ